MPKTPTSRPMPANSKSLSCAICLSPSSPRSTPLGLWVSLNCMVSREALCSFGEFMLKCGVSTIFRGMSLRCAAPASDDMTDAKSLRFCKDPIRSTCAGSNDTQPSFLCRHLRKLCFSRRNGPLKTSGDGMAKRKLGRNHGGNKVLNSRVTSKFRLLLRHRLSSRIERPVSEAKAG